LIYPRVLTDDAQHGDMRRREVEFGEPLREALGDMGSQLTEQERGTGGGFHRP
jgi:hypothetical protein